MSVDSQQFDDDLRTPGPVTERIKPHPDSVEVPSGINGPYFWELGKRIKDGRDAKNLVTAAHGQTGVGKSNLCDFLSYVADTTGEGFSSHKTTIEPERFLELYSVLEPGSALVMEEGGQFDSRRGMTKENVEVTQKWQQARVRQIIAYVNLPDPTMIDGRFERLCDFWINVERRGQARIYRKKIHPTKRTIYYETVQTLEWPNMDGSRTFKHMGSLKNDLLDGELDTDSLVRESECQDRVEKAVRNAKEEKRNEFLAALYNETDLNSREISELSAVGIKGSRIRQIAHDFS